MSIVTQIFATIRDPRWYQVFVLSLLLGFGILVLDFGIHWQNAVAIFATAQATQYLASRFIARMPYDPLSALITSYSLTLLLRTDVIALALLAAMIAIGSKFLVRVRNKHVFNPANVALVSLMLLSDHAWISSGQWGSATIGALALASGPKAARKDLTVLVAGGDGDGLSIGGNHFIHACRRNIDITAIIVNNFIYGMTGGQVAPTAPEGSLATTAPCTVTLLTTRRAVLSQRSLGNGGRSPGHSPRAIAARFRNQRTCGRNGSGARSTSSRNVASARSAPFFST